MTQIKICGITNLSDARNACEIGASLLGFNFYPSSSRFIKPEKCAQITKKIMVEFPQVQLVGVFVNNPVEQVKAILKDCYLNLAQLHGDETPKTMAEFRGQAYKAFRGVPTRIVYSDYTIFREVQAPALLVDASVQGIYGGTGKTADWIAATGLAKRLPILLAGGLNPENVAAAVQQVRPWGVDVATGVEANPGDKDPKKVAAFVQAVRSMD